MLLGTKAVASICETVFLRPKALCLGGHLRVVNQLSTFGVCTVDFWIFLLGFLFFPGFFQAKKKFRVKMICRENDNLHQTINIFDTKTDSFYEFSPWKNQFWCQNVNCLMQKISFTFDFFDPKCFRSWQKSWKNSTVQKSSENKTHMHANYPSIQSCKLGTVCLFLLKICSFPALISKFWPLKLCLFFGLEFLSASRLVFEQFDSKRGKMTR